MQGELIYFAEILIDKLPSLPADQHIQCLLFYSLFIKVADL